MNENKVFKSLKYSDFVTFMHRYEKEKLKSRRHSKENHTTCYQYKSVFKKGKKDDI